MGTMETSENNSERPKRFRPVLGRDELNLAEFPLSSLCRRVPADCRTLVFEDRIRDQGSGELVARRLTVSADPTYGLPNWLDDDVIVGLIQLTKEANGFTDRTVDFSRYALIDLLGWHDTGQSFRRVDESLKRWLGVTLRYEKAWWDKAAQSWIDEYFHIIDNLSLYDREAVRRSRRSGRVPLPFSQFSWNKVVFRSFQAENMKSLDLGLYFRLAIPAAKRAYRFLDKRFHRTQSLTFDLRNFACEHVGLSKNHPPAKLKEKLQPALEELEAAGFLEPMSRQERYRLVDRGEWTIILVSAGKGRTPGVEGTEVLARPRNPAERELTRRGVTPATAAELVAGYPAEAVALQIEVVDWLTARKDKRVSKNPAGYLAESIRKGYATPPGFESKADREKREAAKREKERAEAEARGREREQQARDRAERARVLEYWNGLSVAERRQLDAEALARADPEMKGQHEQARDRTIRDVYLRLIRDQHIRRLLGIGAPPLDA